MFILTITHPDDGIIFIKPFLGAFNKALKEVNKMGFDDPCEGYQAVIHLFHFMKKEKEIVLKQNDEGQFILTE